MSGEVADLIASAVDGLSSLCGSPCKWGDVEFVGVFSPVASSIDSNAEAELGLSLDGILTCKASVFGADAPGVRNIIEVNGTRYAVVSMALVCDSAIEFGLRRRVAA